MQKSEEILVIPRAAIIPSEKSLHGLIHEDCEQYFDLITQHQQFHPRNLMETDPAYKQIIPYLVFEHSDRYFVMQRKNNASETRLQNKFTLGIGGHIRKEDMTNKSILSWAQREFYEEVAYEGTFTIQSVGIINDDTNAVGQVHLGFLFILHADSPHIAIKSELKSGVLMTLDECIAIKNQMETWSAFIVDYLISLH